MSKFPDYKMIKSHLWWFSGKIVCFVCSADFKDVGTFFMTRPRTRNGAARFINKHSSCGLF